MGAIRAIAHVRVRQAGRAGWLAALVAGLVLGMSPARAGDERGVSFKPDGQGNEQLHPEATWARVFDPDALGLWSDYPALQRAWADGIRNFHMSSKQATPSQVMAF